MGSIRISEEEMDCPFCRKGKINVKTTSEFYSMTYARAFGKVKGIPKLHPEKIEVLSNCPKCKKTKREIKEALQRGKKAMTHEERIAMLKKRGLPLVLGSN